MTNLQGKIVLVTGGAGGIGKACCVAFAKEGARVVVAGHSVASASKALPDLPGSGHMAAAVEVQNSKSVDDLATAISANYNGEVPHSVVHCAAVFNQTGSLMDTSEEVWDREIDIDLKGTFLVMKKFIGLMKEKGLKGSFVNLSSIAADGTPASAAYSAAKAGMNGLTKAVAKECAPLGIRVNAVAPGAIGRVMGTTDDVLEQTANVTPMGRVGSYEEVAELCLFLGSDRSTYTTGCVYYITGGLVF